MSSWDRENWPAPMSEVIDTVDEMLSPQNKRDLGEFWFNNGSIIVEPDPISWAQSAARILGAGQPWLLFMPGVEIEDVIASDPPLDLSLWREWNDWLPPMPGQEGESAA